MQIKLIIYAEIMNCKQLAHSNKKLQRTCPCKCFRSGSGVQLWYTPNFVSHMPIPTAVTDKHTVQIFHNDFWAKTKIKFFEQQELFYNQVNWQKMWFHLL